MALRRQQSYLSCRRSRFRIQLPCLASPCSDFDSSKSSNWQRRRLTTRTPTQRHQDTGNVQRPINIFSINRNKEGNNMKCKETAAIFPLTTYRDNVDPADRWNHDKGNWPWTWPAWLSGPTWHLCLCSCFDGKRTSMTVDMGKICTVTPRNTGRQGTNKSHLLLTGFHYCQYGN